MFGESMRSGQGGSRRGWMAGLAFVLMLGGFGTVGATTTLQNLFDGIDDLDLATDPGRDSNGAFTRDGLEFFNFKPALSSTLGDALPLAVSDNWDDPVSIVAALNSLQVLELGDGPREFSFGWKLTGDEGTAADAAGIGTTVLEDNPLTVGAIDPGFRLDSGSTWNVVGADTGSVQLSAFEYTVTRDPLLSEEITSADVLQISEILETDVGPDALPFDNLPELQDALLNGELPDVELPDVAAGFTLQFILDVPAPGQDPNDFAGTLVDENYTLDTGMRVEFDLGRLGSFEEIFPTPFDQDYDWFDFSGRDSVRVVSVVGLLASSDSQFTLDALEQRIDPPPPGTHLLSPPGIPEPETVLLMLMGMLGLGVAHRRRV